MSRFVITSLAGWLTTAQTALAQFNVPANRFDPAQGTDPNVDAFLRDASRLGALIDKVVDIIRYIQGYLLGIGGLIMVLFLVWGGLQYITGQAEAGKKTIVATIVGGVIAGLAVAIINLVIFLIQ